MSLPDLPHELIRVALSDLDACATDPKYRINMRHWHTPDRGVCHVCLAGSVIAKTFRLEPDERCSPTTLEVFNKTEDPDMNAAKLRALNNFRLGAFDVGLVVLCDAGYKNPQRELWKHMHRILYKLWLWKPDYFPFLWACARRDLDAHQTNRVKFKEELNRMADMFERMYNSYQRKVKNNGN